MASPTHQSRILWQPSETQVEQAQVTRFARTLGMEPRPYEALHRFSVAEMDRFWGAFWDFAGIVGERNGDVAVTFDDSARMTGARFFPGATLNVAENLLAGDPDDVAVVEADESGVRREVTLAELRQRVAAAQAGFESLGVVAGDRVAGLLPNDLDAFVCLLAVSSLGAIWSTCGPEFGEAGVVDRFGQIDPRVLVVADDYLYNGRRHELVGKATAIAARLSSLEHVVVIGDAELPEAASAVHRFADLCRSDRPAPRYEQLPFDHPLYIVYTSGTTGMPKCIVHRAGGILLNLRKEHMLHCDVRPGDRVFWFTNTAWMMYHWLVAARASGAAIVLYDGAAVPRTDDGPDPGALWRVVEAAAVTHVGISPKYLSMLEQLGYPVSQEHDVSRVRMVASAGAPLTVENFEWVYREVKQDLCLASISGGTEILGCFVMGNPTAPVRAGEIQGPALGMAVNVLDERDAPVMGRTGELVCTEPFPSMPLSFWGEDGWQRYLDSYFGDRAEIWSHGDLAELRPSGGVVISGRADSVLKPGGVRIGAGEIYRVVEHLPGVADAVAIGCPRAGDVEIWLFVVPTEGSSVDAALEADIRRTLRADASPRHVPARVLGVPEIPYTLSGKKMERAVLQAVTGVEIKNLGSMANPACLDAIREAAAALPGTVQAAGPAGGQAPTDGSTP